MRTEVSVDIPAPISDVWREAVDFASHHEWMSDAADIDFATDQREGVGTTLLIATTVGPLRTVDRFEIVEIVEPNLVRGDHIGAVTGYGEWHIVEIDGGTRFTWIEELRFPWFFGWRLGEIVAKPLMAYLWRKNLESLKERLTS